MFESRKATCAYWIVVLALFGGTTAMLIAYTPPDAEQGNIQKIFYGHLPSAINAFLACLIACVMGILYLSQRKMTWDDLSAAAAKTAAIMCTIVLLTGMIWAKVAWNKYWVWHSPKLIFSLLLWMLYVVYLIVRSSIESPQRRAAVCGVYAIAAFLDVPLAYLAANLIPDIQHPGNVELPSLAMKLTLAAWFVPVTLMSLGLIGTFWRSNRIRRQKQEAATAAEGWSQQTPQADA